MAKLPYTFTVCEPNDAPKQITASSPMLGRLLRWTNDLTIDQRAYMWPATSSDIEGKLREMVNKNKEKNGG